MNTHTGTHKYIKNPIELYGKYIHVCFIIKWKSISEFILSICVANTKCTIVNIGPSCSWPLDCGHNFWMAYLQFHLNFIPLWKISDGGQVPVMRYQYQTLSHSANDDVDHHCSSSSAPFSILGITITPYCTTIWSKCWPKCFKNIGLNLANLEFALLSRDPLLWHHRPYHDCENGHR